MVIIICIFARLLVITVIIIISICKTDVLVVAHPHPHPRRHHHQQRMHSCCPRHIRQLLQRQSNACMTVNVLTVAVGHGSGPNIIIMERCTMQLQQSCCGDAHCCSSAFLGGGFGSARVCVEACKPSHSVCWCTGEVLCVFQDPAHSAGRVTTAAHEASQTPARWPTW